MSYQIPSTQRLCATCGYWIGAREPNYFGDRVVISDQSTRGKCWCLSGPFPRGERLSNMCACSRYEKWQVLR